MCSVGSTAYAAASAASFVQVTSRRESCPGRSREARCVSLAVAQELLPAPEAVCGPRLGWIPEQADLAVV